MKKVILLSLGILILMNTIQENLVSKQEKPMTTSCIFCDLSQAKRKGEIVKRFKHCFAMRDGYPVTPGHTLIIPNEHTQDWFTAPDNVRSDILKAVDLIKKNLDKTHQPDGYNIGINCGKTSGQSVMHLHLHLIPRYKGDMKNPKGGVRGVIPEKQKY